MCTETSYVDLVDQPICMETLKSKIANPDAGAHGWFLGVTRRTTGSRITETLHYEAHDAMARRELNKLAERAVREFSLLHVVIVHRIGEVPISEASVAVGCSSPHRPDTFAALQWIMDMLKKEVPIWKRERYCDGQTEWVHPGMNPDPRGDNE